MQLCEAGPETLAHAKLQLKEHNKHRSQADKACYSDSTIDREVEALHRAGAKQTTPRKLQLEQEALLLERQQTELLAQVARSRRHAREPGSHSSKTAAIDTHDDWTRRPSTLRLLDGLLERQE